MERKEWMKDGKRRGKSVKTEVSQETSVPKKEIPNYTNKLPVTGKTNGEKTSVEYNIGDKVYHTKFGEGMIIGIKNGIGNIFFDKEKASKSILLDHPALSKL